MTALFTDQLSRLRQMAGPDSNSGTWDLSDNDRAAIVALLDAHDDLLAALKEAHFYLVIEGYVARGEAEAHAVMVRINAAITRAETK